jgi:hypothetical protein
MTPAEIAEWLGYPDGPTLTPELVTALANLPVPHTSTEHVAVYKAYLKTVHRTGPYMSATRHLGVIAYNAYKHLGVIAYNAYKASSDGKSLISGDDLPKWDNLPPSIQEAWTAAAMAVAETVSNAVE